MARQLLQSTESSFQLSSHLTPTRRSKRRRERRCHIPRRPKAARKDIVGSPTSGQVARQATPTSFPSWENPHEVSTRLLPRSVIPEGSRQRLVGEGHLMIKACIASASSPKRFGVGAACVGVKPEIGRAHV